MRTASRSAQRIPSTPAAFPRTSTAAPSIVFDVGGSMQVVGDDPTTTGTADDQHALSVPRSGHRLDFDRPLWDSERRGGSGAVAG